MCCLEKRGSGKDDILMKQVSQAVVNWLETEASENNEILFLFI